MFIYIDRCLQYSFFLCMSVLSALESLPSVDVEHSVRAKLAGNKIPVASVAMAANVTSMY